MSETSLHSTKDLLKNFRSLSKEGQELRDPAAAVATWNMLNGGDLADLKPRDYISAAKCVSETGDTEDQIRILRDGVRAFPDDARIASKLAHCLMGSSNPAEGIEFAEKSLALQDRELEWKLLKFKGKVHQKLHDAQETAASWRRCAGHGDALAERCYQAVLDGKPEEAVQAFDALLEVLDFSEDTAREWRDAFAVLHAVNDPQSRAVALQDSSDFEGWRKLSFCGMGYSGSSAIRDFFADCKKTVSHGAEYRQLEGASSIKTLAETRQAGEDIRKELCRFFFISLLGYKIVERTDEFKSLSITRKLSLKAGPAYAATCAPLLQSLIVAFLGSETEQDFLDRIGAVTDRVFAAMASRNPWNGDSDQVHLFDNVVHIKNIKLAELCHDTHFFLSFRDPRSTYAAQKRESVGYTKSVRSFVAGYRKARQTVDALIAEVRRPVLEAHGCAIHQVQFEEFVMSESYRAQLAADCGLGQQSWGKHNSFKPWISARNVFLHETHGDPEENRFIERELPEYCVDLEQYRDEAARLEAIARERGE